MRAKARSVLARLIEIGTRLAPDAWLAPVSDGLLGLRHRTQEEIRRREAAQKPPIGLPWVAVDGEILRRSILERRPPWNGTEVPRCNIPGMLTEAERRYFTHIAKYYRGEGEVVELGPWLGLSTFHILTALRTNPKFETRVLHVFDDFTWRSSWMDKWLLGTRIEAPSNHECFEHLFWGQVGELRPFLRTRRAKLADYDGNEALPLVEWRGGPIEMIIVDCGRTLSVNEGWWRIFHASFMADRTLVVMQDWQNHKTIPERFWENTKIFTDSKGALLELVHEVRGAGIATFLYRGNKP